MLAIQAPLPLNHHHHHTGSNHVTPLTLVDLSRTSARDIQFLSTEKSWRSKDNNVKNMFKPRCCKKRAKRLYYSSKDEYENYIAKRTRNLLHIRDWAEDEARRKTEQDVLKKKEQASKKCWTKARS
ncbi:hypothetical protein Bca4012_002203 [Brassica carinata]